MQVARNMVVAFEYQLKDAFGEVLDSSEKGEPMEYLHGVGGIIPGLEKAMEGRAVGESFQVIVPPEDAYGPHNPKMVQKVSRSNFGDQKEIELGMRFRVQTNIGPRIVTIVDIEGDDVTLDGNHELAGETLHFDITVRNVRQPTPEELEHGHVHGPGCNH